MEQTGKASVAPYGVWTSTPGASMCPTGPFRFGPGQVSQICDQYHFWSLHPGGANFVFADASVHFLTYGVADLLPLLGTRSGGEVVSLP